MPGSQTTPSPRSARDSAPRDVAFRIQQYVSTRECIHFVAQWLAYQRPCQRFATRLAAGHA
ncbi:impA domain protein [Burkholderia cepacia]|nr:impA domain protein [Burkholderia cepacia]